MAYIHALASYMSRALEAGTRDPFRQEAISVLNATRQIAPNDLITGLVCDLLEDHNPFGQVTYAPGSEHAAAFSAFFSHSPAIQNMREELSAWTGYACCASGESVAHIADIGCGDGRAIGQVIKHLARKGVMRVILFLNDTNAGMIACSKEYLVKLCGDLGVTLAITSYEGPAQDEQMTRLLKVTFPDRIDAIVAATSIHHFPAKDKQVFLRRLRKLNPRLVVIGDANSEHDVFLPKSPEIIVNVMRLYNGLYESLIEAKASEGVINAARYFLGSEAREIITGTSSRIDYHTTVEHWKDLLAQASFIVTDPQEIACCLAEGPTSHFRRFSIGHIDSFVRQGEALIFSLGARPQ